MDKYAALKQYFGYDAFREGQEPLIDALLSGRDAFGVMPTGAGKSLCYQIPALLLPGITLVVSPLISLMKDQVTALVQSGVKAAYMNSSLRPDQYATVLGRAEEGWYKIIYVAPERLDAPGFLRFAKAAPVAALIVDEAHCISQWGQDFRPSYLKITDFIAALPTRPAVGAFTATATPRVKRDIADRLGLRGPLCVTTGFDRPNLFFEVWRGSGKDRALAAFLEDKRDKSGIVYCATRKSVEAVCAWLCKSGYGATRYHAGLPDRERRDNQDDFQYDRKPVMVATNAFGMGIDKSNVSYVVHYNMPESLESYYQEAGRAGRDGERADCLLLYDKKDVAIAKWKIHHGGDHGRLSAEERSGVEERNLEKLKWMTYYATAKDCLRNRILRYFGESRDGACGNCGNCRPAAGMAEQPAAKTRKPSAAPRGTEAAPPGEARAVLAALKALRGEIARENGAPAYTVFTDATLTAMASLTPETMDDFGQIIGVGAVKKARYGRRFLARIGQARAAYRNGEEGSVPGPDPRPPAGNEGISPGGPWAAEAPGRGSHGPWTAEEDRRLRTEYFIGFSIGQMAELHGRTKDAVRARIKMLEL